MATETEIVNAALVWLGEDTVDSVDADPAPQRVRKILPHLQPAIDHVLKRHGWLCALEYATLQPAGDVAANWRFPVHYHLPEGGLRFWSVRRTTGWERGVHQLAGGSTREVIRATEGGALDVAYVKRRPIGALDAGLNDAISLTIAARACRPMNGSKERALELQQMAREAIHMAIAADSQDARAEDVVFADRMAALRASAG